MLGAVLVVSTGIALLLGFVVFLLVWTHRRGRRGR